jgi:hypothetical protein
MKKIIITLLSVSILSFALSACTTEEVKPINGTGGQTQTNPKQFD